MRRTAFVTRPGLRSVPHRPWTPFSQGGGGSFGVEHPSLRPWVLMQALIWQVVVGLLLPGHRFVIEVAGSAGRWRGEFHASGVEFGEGCELV